MLNHLHYTSRNLSSDEMDLLGQLIEKGDHYLSTLHPDKKVLQGLVNKGMALTGQSTVPGRRNDRSIHISQYGAELYRHIKNDTPSVEASVLTTEVPVPANATQTDYPASGGPVPTQSPADEPTGTSDASSGSSKD